MTNQLHDERPWGNYTVLGGGDGFQVKTIVVHPGKRLSYQRHQHRAEHWVIVSGVGRVTLEGSDSDIAPGDTVNVPKGQLHRMANPGTDPLIFVEVQLGDYLGEDDIERVEDDFGRA
ncbi:MAG: phosphomannose isomerase type II C-terminal cupin domain [Acidimicrobiia bacterium]|nr:phosphomannose isomerase type II C-terminal cupin domain [Acidimicrobiia bacterium]